MKSIAAGSQMLTSPKGVDPKSVDLNTYFDSVSREINEALGSKSPTSGGASFANLEYTGPTYPYNRRALNEAGFTREEVNNIVKAVRANGCKESEVCIVTRGAGNCLAETAIQVARFAQSSGKFCAVARLGHWRVAVIGPQNSEKDALAILHKIGEY